MVATSLPAIRSLDTDLVTLADTPAAFAGESVARGTPRWRDVPDLVARRRGFAGEHSWGERAARLSELLAAPVPPVP